MERNTFLNVSSPGFTSRIMDRASESLTLKRRKVPVLGFSRLPLLNPSRNIKSSSFIRIAPPEPRPMDINEVHSTEDNENKDPKRKSILQTLNEASKKRSHEQDQNGCDNFIRKKRKEDYRKVQNKRTHEVSWIDEDRTSDGERKRSKRSDNRNRSIEIKADIIVEDGKNDTIEEKTASLDINKEDRSVARMLSFTSSMSIIAPHITRDVSFDQALENSQIGGEYQNISNSKNEITVIADVEPIPKNLDISENMDTTINSSIEETKDDPDTLPTGRVFNRLGMKIPRQKDKNDDMDMIINPIASNITETNQSNGNYEEKLLDDAYGSLTRGEGIDRSRLRRVMNMIKDPPKDDATTLRSILSSPNVKKSPFHKQVTFSVPIVEGNNTIHSKTDNISLEPGTSTLSFTSVNRIDTSAREFEIPKDVKQLSSTNFGNDHLLQKDVRNDTDIGSSVGLGGSGNAGKLNFTTGSKESTPEVTTNSSPDLINKQGGDSIDGPHPPSGATASDVEPKALSPTISFSTSTQPSISLYSTNTTSATSRISFPSFSTVPSTSSTQSSVSFAFGSSSQQSNKFGVPKPIGNDNTVQSSTAFGTTTQLTATASLTVPSSTLFNAVTQPSAVFGEVKEPPAFNSITHSSLTSNTITKPTFGLSNTPASTSISLFGATQSSLPSTTHSTGTPTRFDTAIQSAAKISSTATPDGSKITTSTPVFSFNSTLNANASPFESKGFSLPPKQNLLNNPQTSSTNTTEKSIAPFGNSQLTPSFGSVQSSNFPTFGSVNSGSVPSFGNIPLAPAGFGTTQSTSASSFSTSQSTSSTTAFGTTIQTSSVFVTTQTTSVTNFGTVQQSTTTAFGAAKPGSISAFGTAQSSSSSGFSTAQSSFMPTFKTSEQPTKPAFGMTEVHSTPTFGSTQTSSASTFGNTSLSTNSLFGATQPPSTVSFGTNATSLARAQSTPAFGSFNFTSKPSEPSLFGVPTSVSGQSSVTTAGFGSNTTQAPYTFGSGIGSSTLFGATKETAPATTTSQNSIQASNPAGGFTFTGASHTPPTFGATNNAVPSFGSTANPPAFGTANGSSTFGNSNQPSMFSTAAKSETSFGNSTGVSSVFGASSNQPAFGTSSNPPAFGASTNPPAFGASTNQPSFGASSNQPSFGASSNQPSFGASSNQPAFGASSNPPTFGTPSNQPVFGTTVNPQPAFNVGQSGFASTARTENSVFNFGPSQNTNQPVFTFGQGTPANTQPGAAQPYTFNAALPVTQPSTGGMFSIGSATASSRMRNARNKRR